MFSSTQSMPVCHKVDKGVPIISDLKGCKEHAKEIKRRNMPILLADGDIQSFKFSFQPYAACTGKAVRRHCHYQGS